MGDTIQFTPNYAAFVRLMNGRYIEKTVRPAVETYRYSRQADSFEVAPVLEQAAQ